MKVDILDIGSGNILSIKNWIEKLNVVARVITQSAEIQSDLLILPGVGSAKSYMSRLKAGHYDAAIIEHVDKGGRLLGICLGFQILSSYSEEDDGVQGLNLLKGHVQRLEGNLSHNSWEHIYLRSREMGNQSFHRQHKLSQKRILDGRVFYNHEYGFINQEPDVFSLPISKKLQNYTGLLVKDKIIGMQFHPEKSQKTGLEILSMVL